MITNPKLSVITHHYNNWSCAKLHLEDRARLPIPLLRDTEFVLVDDASSTEFTLDAPQGTIIARIMEDIPWNQPGARNLGVSLATADWLLLTDVDHRIPETSLKQIVDSLPSLDRGTLYRLHRITLSGDKVGPHANTFIVSAEGFSGIGGVDEDFSGHYGCEDKLFEWRWIKNGGVVAVHPSYCVVDTTPHSSTVDLSRDLSRNRALLEAKIKAREFKNSGAKLRFSWEICLVRKNMDGPADDDAASDLAPRS